MSSSRVVPILAVVGAGVGYYFYQAGGDPKLAQKKVENDAARLSTAVKDELPGRAKEMKTDAKEKAQEAGSKLDSAWAKAKAEGKDIQNSLRGYGNEAERKAESARQETGNQLSSAVDKFDKTVEDGASKAKSGISSWFGGSK